jgi:hypothetical protein
VHLLQWPIWSGEVVPPAMPRGVPSTAIHPVSMPFAGHRADPAGDDLGVEAGDLARAACLLDPRVSGAAHRPKTARRPVGPTRRVVTVSSIHAIASGSWPEAEEADAHQGGSGKKYFINLESLI